jgi:CAAX protease family protein
MEDRAEAVAIRGSTNADSAEAAGLSGGWPSALLLLIALASSLPLPDYFWQQLTLGFGLSRSFAPHLVVTMIRDLACVVAILGAVRFLEKTPLCSVGLRRPTARSVLWGVGAFLLAVCSGFGAEHALQTLVPSTFSAVDPLVALPPALLLMTSLVAGFAEEVTMRGCAIEALAALTGRVWVGALLAWLGAILAHVPYRSFLQALTGGPVDGVFVALYLWRRDVSACAVAHILYDSFALVWWPMLPPIWQVRIWRAL